MKIFVFEFALLVRKNALFVLNNRGKDLNLHRITIITMKSKLFIISAMAMAAVATDAAAQRAGGARAHSVQAYGVHAAQLVRRYKALLEHAAPVSALPDSLIDSVSLSPSLFRILGPGVYYKSAVADAFAINGAHGASGLHGAPEGSPASAGSALGSVMEMGSGGLSQDVDRALVYGYVNYPSLFRYTDDRIAKEEIVADAEPLKKVNTKDLEKIYKKAEEIKDVVEVVPDVDVDLRIVRPNFWSTSCNFTLQFSQNYFSEKWYKGGNNNVNLYSNLRIEANYNDQKSIQWDNKLDMRLGFVTATSDSIHRYLTNNDRLYLFSKLGVKAVDNWYYTVSAEGQTQFLPGYRSNDRRTYSDFLAPLDVFVAIGIDFKPKLKKGSLSAMIQPLTYKIRYIGADDETIHASYNMRGKDFQQDFGSKIEVNTNFTLAKNFTWRSRYYFFTSYEYVESEWENVFSFRFNKYITSEVNTIWRFDDNRDKRYVDSTLGYFQFKENFSLGLSYNF